MKRWLPDSVYNARPWVMMGGGAVLAVGSMVWSMVAGDWGVWRGLACFLGAGLVIGGGAIVQLRQQYRARSKWRRTNAPR